METTSIIFRPAQNRAIVIGFPWQRLSDLVGTAFRKLGSVNPVVDIAVCVPLMNTDTVIAAERRRHGPLKQDVPSAPLLPPSDDGLCYWYRGHPGSRGTMYGVLSDDPETLLAEQGAVAAIVDGDGPVADSQYALPLWSFVNGKGAVHARKWFSPCEPEQREVVFGGMYDEFEEWVRDTAQILDIDQDTVERWLKAAEPNCDLAELEW
jgi:hypothetical protein